jgi:hypothetical protein
MDSWVLALAALGVSAPFGLLSAGILRSSSAWPAWLVGLVLCLSLFAYTIFLALLMKRHRPLLLKCLFPRKDVHQVRSISEMSGLCLDYIGAKDPQDTLDGVVHNRAGELQRILRCSLPQHCSFAQQSMLLETLFADLARFDNARFQIIFPDASTGRRKEMIVIASALLPNSPEPAKDEPPPLVQMQSILEHLLERLITLGIAPKVMNAVEVRQLISAELGGCASRCQLHRDWRNVGNLGWEPSFRDIILRPSERFMQVADRRSVTISLEQLPALDTFEWFSVLLADIPFAHVSLFITPWRAGDAISKLLMTRKLKKHSAGGRLATVPAAQMSFFFRFDGRDAAQLESEVAVARKYFVSLGINRSSLQVQRQEQQLQNWRSTLPCAQEQSHNKHLIAFMRSSQSPS